MPLSPPVLNGVVLPRPSEHTREPEPLEDVVELAGGGTAAYHRGYVNTFSLAWAVLTAEQAAPILAAGRRRGVPASYVDLDGVAYVVRVVGSTPMRAIPGTDPVRYRTSLTLREVAPR